MNACETFRPQLTAMLDNELPPAEAARVNAHLTECAGCIQALAVYRRLRLAVRQSPLEPADTWMRISSKLPEIAPDIAAEMRAIRQEMQALREEIAAWRRETAERQAGSNSPAISLNFPYAPPKNAERYRLV